MWHSSLLSSEKHVSSFIIQCNWTRVRVYRYLVSQQKHHARKAVNTVKAVTHSWMFLTEKSALTTAMYKKIYKKISPQKSQLCERVCMCVCVWVCAGYTKFRRNKKAKWLTCEVALYGYPNCEKDIAASFVTISNILHPWSIATNSTSNPPSYTHFHARPFAQ